ncbi:MAG TPA: ABC transporter ATP-binding protein, partial [Vicinamibacteria bacterium]|nr:ABC transporter ATP-binding protein [Vicinamibacteria bacterium]
VERLTGRGRTVIITTHYMEEAARLCDRVAIVDRGKVVATDTPAALVSSLGAEHVVEFAVEEGADLRLADDALRTLPSVEGVARGPAGWRLRVREVHRAVPALLTLLAGLDAAPTRLTTHHATLEDVFMALTGRSLRDE